MLPCRLDSRVTFLDSSALTQLTKCILATRVRAHRCNPTYFLFPGTCMYGYASHWFSSNPWYRLHACTMHCYPRYLHPSAPGLHCCPLHALNNAIFVSCAQMHPTFIAAWRAHHTRSFSAGVPRCSCHSFPTARVCHTQSSFAAALKYIHFSIIYLILE
jgi:hypothetical protein